MTDDDTRTRRWQRISAAEIELDPLQALRTAIAGVRARPRDDEARRQLRAVAGEHNAWEQLAVLLADEARVADGKPELAAVLWSELADVHETLDQTIEEIAALEMVVSIAPNTLEVHDRLARLYHRAGAWGKAALAFEQVAALAQDSRARAALRAAGRLYREHGKLDRAVDVYRAMVDRKPSDLEAWRELDEVLAALGRWRELADVRGELAERAANPVDKAVLLRSQARALEELGDATGAAELVARAAQHAPDDVSGLVDYAGVLARSGKGDQAASVLRDRIVEARRATTSSDEVPALQLRLVAILDDVCGDQAAADAVLDELLADAPTYAPALERLVARTAQRGEPVAHADAIVRHAAALPDAGDRAAAFAEAARRYREANDLRNCVRAFDAALELVPDDDNVARELADAKSALAVQRALAEAGSGELEPAIDRLRAILDSRPLDVAANLALADVLERGHRASEAVAHLRGALADAAADASTSQLAPLVFRLARATAALGNDDEEAHRLLHEAHRLDRRDLAITMALGESCYRRRLWREAALHLGSLADHPDARSHASVVATALVHAARAETRALRPTNAPKHYEAALRIDPKCGPAWHAVGELAVERGDTARALDCFEREVAATADPHDRARLADAAAERAWSATDPARAERLWASVVDVADAPALTKLLTLQRARGAGRERGETCVRLAALASEARVKQELLEEAAQAFSAGGELARARQLAEQLIAASPLEVDAVVCATGIAIEANDRARAAQWLRRALAAWDGANDRGVGDPRRAELWRRLGDCERDANNARAALAAYQRAVATAPDADGALAARRGLVELAASAGRPAGASLVELVEAEHAPADVLAYGRELDQRGAHDDATAMFELAYALDPSLGSDDEILRATSPALLASDVAYGTKLGDVDRHGLIDDPDEEPLGELLELVAEALPLLCADARGTLDRAGLADARRLPATSEAAAAATFPQIANALGGNVALLYASARAPDDARVVLASPPIIVLGPRLVAMRARSHTDAHPFDVELRFRLGRAIELARPRRVLAVGDPDVFTRMLAALPHACGRGDVPSDPDVHRDADRLRNTLPAQLRRRIAEQLADTSSTSLPSSAQPYLDACQRAADRAGLLACGHVAVAVELAGGAGVARHLVELAASQRYLTARRALRPRRA